MKKVLFLLMFCCIGSYANAQEVKMKSILNAENLKGWLLPEGNEWTVKNGILSAQSGPEKKGSILWTKKAYSNFIVQLDFKMGQGIVDSGVFLRTDQEQIQIGESGSLKRDMTCSPYIPGKGYPVEAEGIKDILQLSSWNTLKIQVIDHTYIAWLNGHQVMTYESDNSLLKGPIGLQLHPNREMNIDFRNIQLATL